MPCSLSEYCTSVVDGIWRASGLPAYHLMLPPAMDMTVHTPAAVASGTPL